MKKSKLLLQISTLLIGLVLIFELTGSYMNEYTSAFSRINVKSTNEYSSNELIQFVLENKPENIDMFVATTKSRSEVMTEAVYYASTDVKQMLEDEYDIKPGVYRSIFSQNLKITYEDLLCVETENNFVPVYFLGDTQDINSFIDNVNKQTSLNLELVEPYNLNHSNQKVFLIWGLAVFLLLSLTIYDVACQRKEATVRAIYGEKISSIVIKNILIDFFICCASVFVLISVLKLFYGNFVFGYQTLLALLVFIILNSLIYLSLFKINLKKDLSSRDSGKGVLYSSYLLKLLSTGVTLALLLISLTSFKQSFQFVNSSKMYNDFSNKSFVQVIPDELSGEDYFDGIEKLESLSNQIYVDKFEESEPILLSKDFGFYEDCSGVLVNKYAKEYVINSFPEIDEDTDITFFVREEYRDESVFQRIVENYTLNGEFSSEVVYYTDNRTLNVLSDRFEDDNLSVENPLLVYFNLDKDEWNILLSEKPDVISNSFRNIAFASEVVVTKSLSSDYELNAGELIITKFSEQYQEQFKVALMRAAASLVMLILTLVFDIQITKMALSMKFKAHGKEFAIKKVSGYSDFQLYLGTVVTNFIIYAIGAIAIIVFIHFESMAISMPILIAGIAVTLMIEVISFAYMLKKMCIDRVQKTLKGGML